MTAGYFTPEMLVASQEREVSLSMEQQKAVEQHELSLRLADRVQKQYREFKEAEAFKDQDNVAAAKVLYQMNTGNEFEGSDEDVVRYGIDEMGRFNHSFFQATEGEVGMVGYMQKMFNDDTTDLQKLAFLHMVESYDAMDADNWEEIKRFGGAMVKDPTNYAGVSALVGMGIKLGGKKLGGTAALQMLKKGVALSVLGSIEGAGFGGATADLNQRARMAASDNDYVQLRRAYDTSETAMGVGVGALAGAALPQLPKVLGAMWDGLGVVVDKTSQHGTLGMGVGPLDNTLPVDKASRIARAKEMDFDTDAVWYHGTSSDITEFNLDQAQARDFGYLGKGIYVASSPDIARAYANTAAGNVDPNIMPLHTRANNPKVITLQDKAALKVGGAAAAEKLQQEAIAAGHDSIDVVLDSGEVLERVIFNPEDIRSQFAEFDPKKSQSKNILASGAGATVVAGAANEQDEEL